MLSVGGEPRWAIGTKKTTWQDGLTGPVRYLQNPSSRCQRIKLMRRQVSTWGFVVAVLVLLIASGCGGGGTLGPGFTPLPIPEEDSSGNSFAVVWFLLDQSGSMDEVRGDVIDGFNGFVSDLRNQPGECLVTLALFDGLRQMKTVFSVTPVAQVPFLSWSNYLPDGQTPFYDALGSLIQQADSRVAQRVGDGLPVEDQLVVILTDGLENDSYRFSQRDIRELVHDRQNQGWTFAFLGANQDAYAEGARIGLVGGNIQNFDVSEQSIARAYLSVSSATVAYCGKSTLQRKASGSNFFGGFG